MLHLGTVCFLASNTRDFCPSIVVAFESPPPLPIGLSSWCVAPHSRGILDSVAGSRPILCTDAAVLRLHASLSAYSVVCYVAPLAIVKLITCNQSRVSGGGLFRGDRLQVTQPTAQRISLFFLSFLSLSLSLSLCVRDQGLSTSVWKSLVRERESAFPLSGATSPIHSHKKKNKPGEGVHKRVTNTKFLTACFGSL